MQEEYNIEKVLSDIIDKTMVTKLTENNLISGALINSGFSEDLLIEVELIKLELMREIYSLTLPQIYDIINNKCDIFIEDFVYSTEYSIESVMQHNIAYIRQNAIKILEKDVNDNDKRRINFRN